jgi:hypothetical protein
MKPECTQARRHAAFLLVFLLLAAGCAKRTTGSQPLPADYRLSQSLAVLVEANKAATATAIQLNQAMVIDDATTAALLSYTGSVAQAVKSALALMDSDMTADQKTAQIQALFARITQATPVKQFLQAHQNEPAANALVAALQTVQLLIENIVKGVY